MFDGIKLLQKIKNNELKFNQKINVYFDNTLTGTLDLEAVLIYRGDEVLWSENTFRFSMLYDDNYLFEIVGDKKIEKLKIKDDKLIGKWKNGRDYNYTLSAQQNVITNKINELIDVVNELKNEVKE